MYRPYTKQMQTEDCYNFEISGRELEGNERAHEEKSRRGGSGK